MEDVIQDVKEEKEKLYLSGVLDVFEDTFYTHHTNYTHNKASTPNNNNKNNNNNNNNNNSPSPPSFSPTSSPTHSAYSSPSPSRGASRNSSKKKPQTPQTPAQFLHTFDSKLIPQSECIDSQGDLDYNKYVGTSTQEQVKENVTEWAKNFNGPPPSAELPFSRCVVCTLAFGSCVHTRDWLQYTAPQVSPSRASSRAAAAQYDATEALLFDMEDVLETGKRELHVELKKGIRTKALPLSYISNMHWAEVNCRPADNIEGNKLDLSSPPAMGGCVGVEIPNKVGQPHLIIHGGIRYPNNGVFHAYSSTLIGSKQVGIYDSNTYVYSMVELTWHVPDCTIQKNDKPKGRYGHVAVVIPDTRQMWTFGGRQEAGVCSDEVHIWTFDTASWELKSMDREIYRVPAPRFGSSACFAPNEGQLGSIILFGGRDGTNNFGDLWIYDLSSSSWSDPVCIGIPPAPRHGHTLVSVDDEKIMILGGCCVSPFSETGIPDNIDELDDALGAASKRVAECYELEKAEAQVAGIVIESEADFLNWKQIARLSAQASAAIALREKNTNDAENELNLLLQERAAAMHWAKMNSEHGRTYVSGVHDHKFMDVILLDLQSKVWTEPTAPPCSGSLPLARMNHSATNIAGKIIVAGGCHPTTTRVTMSDNDIHVLDIASWKWTLPAVEDTPFAMLPTLNAAKTAVRRAERVRVDEFGSAQMSAVPGGRSIQVAEAEAVLKVCQWRLKTLQDQCSALRNPPNSRYGHAAVAMGQRIYFVGGWELTHSVGCGNEMVVLDLEQPDERERRLREEFHARLERERRIQEFEEQQKQKQLEYENRIRLAAERRREADELERMIYEDALSRLPPKTFAPTPRLKYANKHTIWVQWDKVTVNSEGEYVHPNNVTYRLFARGGFMPLEKNVEVYVMYAGEQKKKKGRGEGRERFDDEEDGSMFSGSASFANLSQTLDDNASVADSITSGSGSVAAGGKSQIGQYYPAVIEREMEAGQFYIKYDGGGHEAAPRNRILPRVMPVWELVYSGQELNYAYLSSIPDYTLEKEEGIVVSVEFVLQTIGTEHPIEEPSLHGDHATMMTVNNTSAVKLFFEGMKKPPLDDGDLNDENENENENEEGLDNDRSSSKVKEKLKKAIETDIGIIESWHKGQLVEGTGVGEHYV